MSRVAWEEAFQLGWAVIFFHRRVGGQQAHLSGIVEDMAPGLLDEHSTATAKLNKALHTIARTRMQHDVTAKDYVQQRRTPKANAPKRSAGTSNDSLAKQRT